MKRGMTLRQRIILVGLVPILLFALILSGYLISTRIEDGRTLFQEKGASYVQELATAAYFGLFISSEAVLKRTAEQFLIREHVYAIEIRDDQDKLIIALRSSRYQDTGEIDLRTFRNRVDAASMLDINSISMFDESAHNNDYPLGEVVVIMTLQDKRAREFVVIKNTLAILLLVLMPMIALLMLISRQVVRPLEQILHQVKEAGARRFDSRLSVTAKGELALLEQGINTMMAELQSYESDLNQKIADATAELHQRNEQLEEARQQAMDATQAKSQFLAHMSHEIRTPMNGVLGFMRALQKTTLSTKQQSHLQFMQHAATDMLNIVNQILDLAKIEAGKLEVKSEPVNLQELAQSICTLQLPEAEAKGIVCLIHFDEALYTPVYTDAYLLRRVLSNLISNAIKYTQAGQIEVRFETGARTAPDSLPLIITIADTGIGMDKDLLEQLFEPFIQAQSHRYQSTGLGLAIVKGIVDSMQGQIRVASKPGLGSSFVIELQLATSPQPLAVAADNAESVTLDLTGIRILVVDDSPINQRLLQVLLEMQGATIKTCATGQAALDAMQADAIDIILLDIHLPDSQGVELSQQLHAVPGCASIPIIALTADMIAMENMRNVSPHIQQWLGKPFDETELLQAIASALQLSLTARSDNSADSQLGQDDDRQVKLLAMRQELRAQLQQELPAAIAELHAQLSTNARDAFAASLHRLKGAAAVARHQRLQYVLAELEEQLSKNADSATLLIQLEQLRLLLD